jgi:hypothetical protein
MLIFFDETFRVSERNPAISLGALCGIALPEDHLARIAQDVFALKRKHLGADYANEKEIKGKDIFKNFAFKLEQRGIRSNNLAFANDLLDYVHQRKLRVFGCVCFEKNCRNLRSRKSLHRTKHFAMFSSAWTCA